MKNNIEVEICTFSLESCLNAQLAGASRVELCSGMYDGGTTPSAAMIRMAREKLSIQLYVMIRPRGGDFLYSDLEFEEGGHSVCQRVPGGWCRVGYLECRRFG